MFKRVSLEAIKSERTTYVLHGIDVPLSFILQMN